MMFCGAKSIVATMTCLFFLSLSRNALAQSTLRVWRGDAASSTSAAVVQWKDSATGEVVGTVPISRLRLVQDVKRRIEPHVGVLADWYIVEGRTPNAFASTHQGASIVALNLAMMEMIGDDADSYAAVLGHEFAHLQLHHSEARESRELFRQSMSAILGFMLSRARVQMAGTLADFATTAVSRTYSRDEEREADELGLRIAAASGFDPQGAVRLWQRMAERQPSSIPFLDTHPSSHERIANMQKVAGSLFVGVPMSQRIPANFFTYSAEATAAIESIRKGAYRAAYDTCVGPAKRGDMLCDGVVVGLIGRGLIDVSKSQWPDVSLLRIEAERGDTSAQYELANLYENGAAGLNNRGEAVKWYRAAAAQGHSNAQLNLAWMYEHGIGVSIDIVEAYALYRRASLDRGSTGVSAGNSIEELKKEMSQSQIDEGETRAGTRSRQ